MARPSRASSLALLATQVRRCRRCPLGYERLHAVPGHGNPHSPIVFLGEGPGFQEDHQGEPFVGRSGKLLNEMIETELGRTRAQVYISNAVKCHPMVNPKDPEARGNDRPPTPKELEACRAWWTAELELIRPKIVCLLGASAVRAFFGEQAALSSYRGKLAEDARFPGTLITAVYHPSAILRNPPLREDYANDFRKLKAQLNKLL